MRTRRRLFIAPQPAAWPWRALVPAAGLLLASLAAGPAGAQAPAVQAGGGRERPATAPQDASAPREGSPAARLGVDLAAIGTGVELPFEDLDALLLWRHAKSQDGREGLTHLLKLELLETLGAEAGVEVTRTQLNKSWSEFERQLEAKGVEGGVRTYLADSGVALDVFRRTLRLGIIHERLTRRALGLGPDAPLTGEQQTLWIDGVIESRGYEEREHPFEDGVVAVCGNVTITRDAFVGYLREQLPRDTVTDACYQLLLERSVLARLPDVSPEALERAVARELERRRLAAASDPKYAGISYEQLLATQGLSVEALRRDPAVRVAAMANLWVDRAHDDRALRTVYAAERDAFDGLFGEAVQIYLILLHAAKFKNDLNPRTFEEAEAELADLRARSQGLEDFKRLAAGNSEDPRTRGDGGLLGWVTRGMTDIPQPVRAQAFAAIDERGDGAAGTVLGPIRLQGACVLAMLGARRPAPSWEVMSEHVHRELRRRFLDGVLARGSVATWLDVDR